MNFLVAHFRSAVRVAIIFSCGLAVPRSNAAPPASETGASKPGATAPATASAVPAIFALRRDEMPVATQLSQALVTEMIRQAYFISARDELGLRTRDAALREPLTHEADAKNFGLSSQPFDVNFFAQNNELFAVINPPFDERLFQKIHVGHITYVEGLFDCSVIEEQIEPLTRKEFVDALRNYGLDGKRNKWVDDGDVPDQISMLIQSMNPIVQLDAVRRLHALIRTDGESPQRLGALSIAYANLGQLCEICWNQESKVFAARSLMYAQRYVSAMNERSSPEPAKALAIWHRAYCRAMAGLHQPALLDLDEASKLAETVCPPDWVPLIDHLCHYDTKALADAAINNASLGGLASLLSFMTTEGELANDIRANPIESGKLALRNDPQDMTVIDGMCEMAGVTYLHRLTEAGPEILSQSLAHFLPRMPNIPANVQTAIAHAGAVGGTSDAKAQVFIAMCDAGTSVSDSSEPSWAAMGRLVQEIRFVQTYRRADFLQNKYGDPEEAASYVQEIKPLIADHPYHALIESITIRSDAEQEKLRDALKSLKLAAVSLRARPLWTRLQSAGIDKDSDGKQVWEFGFDCADATAWDQERCIRYNPQQSTDYMKPVRTRLLLMTPFSPTGRMATITNDWWNSGQKNAAAWEKAALKTEPSVLAALSSQYIWQKKYADAERCLREWIEVSPDHTAFELLADNYLAQGDEPHYLSTLKSFLKEEDYGLYHALTLQTIADHLTKENRAAEALPYAKEAADSGAGWALLSLARCEEQLGHWPEANAALQSNYERYNASIIWFEWCRRTGHGDVASAAKVYRDAVLKWDPNKGRDWALGPISYELMNLDLDPASAGEASKLLDTQLNRGPGDIWCGLQLALLCDVKHDHAGRDSAMQRGLNGADQFTVDEEKRTRPQLVKFARAIQATWTTNAPLPDARTVDALIADAIDSDRPTIAYFAARLYDSLGNHKLADQYYLRAASAATFDFHPLNAILGCIAVHNRGIDSTVPATQPATPQDK